MVINALTRVFCRPIYLSVAIVISLCVFTFSVWLPNLKLILKVLSSDAQFLQRLKFPVSLLGSIATNFSLLSAFYSILIAILFGINVAMVIFFLRRRLTSIKQSGVALGFFGILSGILGVGCAACGSFLIVTLITWSGVGALVAALPLKGGEFGVISIILLLISLYQTAKQIEDPLVCKI